MANVIRSERKWTLNTQDVHFLGNPSDQIVGTVVLMLVSSSFVGSITVKSRICVGEASAVTPVAVQYSARYLNGAISDDDLHSTAITDTSLILVPASGQSIVLDCTAYTSGTMTVYQIPLAGAAV